MNLSIHFSLIGRAFSIFWQKKDGPKPSEMDIKVFNPAPACCLQSKKVNSINGKKKNISLVRKMKWKYKMHFKKEKNMKNLKNYHPRAHFFFINYNNSSVFTFCKWGETSSTTILLLIRTSSD